MEVTVFKIWDSYKIHW